MVAVDAVRLCSEISDDAEETDIEDNVGAKGSRYTVDMHLNVFSWCLSCSFQSTSALQFCILLSASYWMKIISIIGLLY